MPLAWARGVRLLSHVHWTCSRAARAAGSLAKIDVNGPHAHPLYKYLKDARPGLLGSEAIKWNFTKFLIGRNGVPAGRYAPQAKPEELQAPIRALL